MELTALSALILSLASGTWAQVKTVSAVRCYTKLGPKPVAEVATRSAVLTLPFAVNKKITSTPTYTITPPNVVIISTGTTTSTSTTVTTTTVSTSVVPTTAGFVPIESSVAGAGDVAAKRDILDARLDIPEGHQLEERQARQQSVNVVKGQVVLSPPLYPTSVKCAGLVFIVSTRTSTVTAPTTTTTLPATTVIGTSIVTETTTTTQTSTAIEIQPLPTYAACAADNIASRVGNRRLVGLVIQRETTERLLIMQTASAYDCCVACQTYNEDGGRCSASIYYARESSSCFLAVGSPNQCVVSSLQICADGQGICSGLATGFASNGCYAITPTSILFENS